MPVPVPVRCWAGPVPARSPHGPARRGGGGDTGMGGTEGREAPGWGEQERARRGPGRAGGHTGTGGAAGTGGVRELNRGTPAVGTALVTAEGAGEGGACAGHRVCPPSPPRTSPPPRSLTPPFLPARSSRCPPASPGVPSRSRSRPPPASQAPPPLPGRSVALLGGASPCSTALARFRRPLAGSAIRCPETLVPLAAAMVRAEPGPGSGGERGRGENCSGC